MTEDNREAFQAELNAGILDLRGRPGRYYVTIPPPPRQVATLTMPDGSSILGDGPQLTTIVFRGDPRGRDWTGIRVGNRWKISGVSLVVEEPGGTWDEQSHVIEIVGPCTGGELSYSAIDHPKVPGSKRGDCMRFRGYPPLVDGSEDRRIWDQHIHHVTFLRAARSSVSIHSGLHGRILPPDQDGEIHSSTRFHHTVHMDTADQDLDEEGSGDVGGISADDVVEWDHNVHSAGPQAESAIAISLYPGSTWLHHNMSERGVDLLGGNHRMNHNLIKQTIPYSGPVVWRRKEGTTTVHDDVWIREPAAGPGHVFVAEQKLTAPTDVRISNTQIVQHTPATPIVVRGVVGFVMSDVVVMDDAPLNVRDGIRIEGTNGATGIRSTGVVIAACSFDGRFRAAISMSGWYTGGSGTLSVSDCRSDGAIGGLRCEDVERTATSGGILGPILWRDNYMPVPNIPPGLLRP